MLYVGEIQEAARRIRENVARVLVGAESTVELMLVALLCEGRLLAVGSAAEVLTPARLSHVYGVEIVVAPHPLYGTPLVVPAIDRDEE